MIPDWTGQELPPPSLGTVIQLKSAGFEFDHTVLGEHVRVYPGTLIKVDIACELSPGHYGIKNQTLIWMDKSRTGAAGYVPVELVRWASKDKDLKRLEVIL